MHVIEPPTVIERKYETLGGKLCSLYFSYFKYLTLIYALHGHQKTLIQLPVDYASKSKT